MCLLNIINTNQHGHVAGRVCAVGSNSGAKCGGVQIRNEVKKSLLKLLEAAETLNHEGFYTKQTKYKLNMTEEVTH